jgi:hypothetical protein
MHAHGSSGGETLYRSWGLRAILVPVLPRGCSCTNMTRLSISPPSSHNPSLQLSYLTSPPHCRLLDTRAHLQDVHTLTSRHNPLAVPGGGGCAFLTRQIGREAV